MIKSAQVANLSLAMFQLLLYMLCSLSLQSVIYNRAFQNALSLIWQLMVKLKFICKYLNIKVINCGQSLQNEPAAAVVHRGTPMMNNFRSIFNKVALYHQVQITMSLNNSESSNIFVLSSDESSRRNFKDKKHSFAAFVNKIKLLLEVQEEDLNQIYRKIEIIVKRYFDDHKIFQFRDMYDHIVALKSNSRQMSLIVDVLEKRLFGEELRVRLYGNCTTIKSSEGLQLASSVHKENNNLKNRNADEGPKQICHSGQNDSTDLANSFAQHNPTLKSTEQELIEQKGLDKEGMTSHIQSKSISPSPLSLTKLNSSFEQYQNRNKQYEQKVKSLMKQLEGIKKSIGSKPKLGRTREEDGEQKPKSNQLLQIDLKSNRQKEERSQQTIIDGCAQKHFAVSGKSSQSLPNHKPHQTRMEVIKEKSKESILSSQKGITDSQKGSRHKVERHEVSLRNALAEQSDSAKQTQKSINLLQYSANISKQIQQLKEVAARLHLQSNRTVSAQNPKQSLPLQSQELISQTRLNTLIKKASQEKSHRPILEIMDHTTSEHQVSEDQLPSPSFKQINDRNQSSNADSLKNSSSHIRNSSSAHSSQKQLQSHKNSFHIPYQQQQQASPPFNRLNFNHLPRAYEPQFPEYPHELSTVKVIYNPYPVPQTYNPSLVPRPQPFRQSINPGLTNKSLSFNSLHRAVNPSMIYAPMMSSSNSATSIMHPHLFNNTSHLKPIPENPSNRLIKIGLNVANRQQSTKSFNNLSTISNSSHKRRGLNIISPPPKQTQ